MAVGVLTLGAACGIAACGGARQDADEPSGHFKVGVVKASFPAQQAVAAKQRLRIEVRNADSKAVPNVAVTIATRPGKAGGAPQAFSSDIADPRAADPSQPIWIVDKGPVGGETAVTNTWTLGRLPAGQTRTFVWKVTPVKPGSYTMRYSVSPGLTGKAKPASGARTRGTFKVKIDDTPPTARVGDGGKVIESPGE